jgi:flagellar basal-body rod modification protein FlgD
MAVEPTSSVTRAATSQLRLDELLRVLLTELTHQDPFKPMDNKDFMAQMAQFASLDTTQQLNDNILQMLSLQAINQSVALFGKEVSALNGDGTVINGEVIAVTMNDGAPRLTVRVGGPNGSNIPGIAIGQLQTVRP